MSDNAATFISCYNNIKKMLMPMIYLFFQHATFTNCTASHFPGSVDDIIDHYKKEQIVEGYNLKEPVSVQVITNIYFHYSTFAVKF